MEEFRLTPEIDTFSNHLSEAVRSMKAISIALVLLVIFWSWSVSSVISAWVGILPIQSGPENMNLAVFAPFDWVGTRISAVIMLSTISVLPLASALFYRFSAPGLLPREERWLSSIMLFTTFVIPLAVISIWIWVLPNLFSLASSSNNFEGVGIRYDVGAIFSVSLGASWVLIIWSLTAVSLSLARMYGLVENSELRFRLRILAIFCGTLILTLPVEYDGLRVTIAFFTALSADAASRLIPLNE